MSSIAERPKPMVSSRRGYFLKSNSFQKIKCSAVYPFQLAGLKFNRDTLKSLFEALFIKARTLSQKALLVLMVVTLKFIGAVLLLWVNASAKKSIHDGGACDKQKKMEAILSFHERIMCKAQRLQRYTKNKTENKNIGINLAQNKTRQIDIVAKKPINTNTNGLLAVQPINNPIKTQQKSVNKQNNVQRTFFKIFVYCGAIFTYLQFFILTFALNTTNVPPGLVFLISSLLLIAYIILKVLFMEQNKKDEARKSLRLSKNLSTSMEAIDKPKQTNNRPSRTRYRSLTIDWDKIRLSKVKLL